MSCAHAVRHGVQGERVAEANENTDEEGQMMMMENRKLRPFLQDSLL